MVVSNISKSNIICYKCFVANTFWTRLKGLLGRTGLASSEGLLITPCNSVHTIGMRFSIDVIFLTADKVVLAMEEGLRPNRVSKYYREAKMVVELSVGSIQSSGVQVGDQISFVK